MPCRLITIVDKHDKLDTKRNSTFDSLLPNTKYFKKVIRYNVYARIIVY